MLPRRLLLIPLVRLSRTQSKFGKSYELPVNGLNAPPPTTLRNTHKHNHIRIIDRKQVRPQFHRSTVFLDTLVVADVEAGADGLVGYM